MPYSNLLELLKDPIIYAILLGAVIGVINYCIIEILKKLSKYIRERVTIETWKIAIIVSAIFIIIGLMYVFGPYKNQNISDVPDLTGLSRDVAASKLGEAGLRSDFKERFNCTVEKNYVIPGTQDPKSGTYVQKNSSVEATVSLGRVPDVNGLEEDQAILTLRESKLNFTVMNGRNATAKENHVYDQDPGGCETLIPGSTVRIFVNRANTVSITTPFNGEEVNSPTALEGKISVPLLEHEHLWIVVNPREALRYYYPQSGGPIIPRDDLTFTGNAYLGAGSKVDIGKRYDLLVLVLGDDLNNVFKDYMKYGESTKDWRSITEWTSSSGKTISQEDIVKSIKGRVSDVGLKGYS